VGTARDPDDDLLLRSWRPTDAESIVRARAGPLILALVASLAG
jgi:hypothetical protein